MGRIGFPVVYDGTERHERRSKDFKSFSEMSIDLAISLYLVSLLLTLGLLVLYSELRRKRFEPEPSEDHIFRCGKCGLVYTDDPDVDRSRCPQCGCMNEMITF
jgi:hypothetical protein